MPIELSTTVLDGVSLFAPGIDGDGLFGVAAVWADAANNGLVTLAFSGSMPPYTPLPLSPAWTTFDTPAVAIASDWDRLYVAFVDFDGFVQLATSADGWNELQTISPSGGIDAAPALVYSENLLYAAWKTPTSQLAFATIDQNGQVTYFESELPLTSRPTICAEDTARIYVSCGGAVGAGPQPISIYLSLDGGMSFAPVATPAIEAFGPPSVVLLDKFYVAWADGSDSRLRLAVTEDLGTLNPMEYDAGCHEGGPALVPMVQIVDVDDPSTWIFSLTSGWSVGSSDSNLHHVAIGSLGPLPVGATQIEQKRARIARLAAPRAPNPCPDPLTVYDPATGKCVSKLGCWGGCVLSSYSGTPAGPLFNPVAYAVCVIRCKSNGG